MLAGLARVSYIYFMYINMPYWELLPRGGIIVPG